MIAPDTVLHPILISVHYLEPGDRALMLILDLPQNGFDVVRYRSAPVFVSMIEIVSGVIE